MGIHFEPSNHHAVVVPGKTYFDEMNEDFSLIDHDMFDSLMRRYMAARETLQQISDFMAHHSVDTQLLDMFFKGNISDHRVNSISSLYYDRIFNLDGAIKALDARYWQEAIALTKVMELLPAKRRNEWNEGIEKMQTPAFTEDNLRSTFLELFSQRKNYFAERVDGLFRALSHEHVTNRPEGFSKRLITYARHDLCFFIPSDAAYIEDLRQVVAILLKRETPKDIGTGMYNLLDTILRTGRTGEWFSVDGGAFSLRLYKKGTVHIDIHPSVAWQLNRVLSHLYPQAIPAQFKTPKKQQKNVKVKPMTTPLPQRVLVALNDQKDTRPKSAHIDGKHHYLLKLGHIDDKFIRAHVIDILTAIGGKSTDGETYAFDYDFNDAITEIVFSGCLPDAKSHQFYPTPNELAEYAASLLDVTPEDRNLEPSAGTGNLAMHLPKAQTTCVEYAPLHCEILRSKGFDDVQQGDFLAWAPKHQGAFDKVLINPPFTASQAEAHLDAALTCLARGGKLVAILPSGMATRWRPSPDQHANVEWTPAIHNAFPGTSVSVTIAIITK